MLRRIVFTRVFTAPKASPHRRSGELPKHSPILWQILEKNSNPRIWKARMQVSLRCMRPLWRWTAKFLLKPLKVLASTDKQVPLSDTKAADSLQKNLSLESLPRAAPWLWNSQETIWKELFTINTRHCLPRSPSGMALHSHQSERFRLMVERWEQSWTQAAWLHSLFHLRNLKKMESQISLLITAMEISLSRPASASRPALAVQ